MILFWGKVRHGDKRGKSLGYPTANMALHKKLEEGVYVSKTKVEDAVVPSVTFVGSAKTFGKKEYQAETYLLDFNSNLYGKYLTIMLLKKLRGNKKFDNANELAHQMKQDEIAAREFFKKHS